MIRLGLALTLALSILPAVATAQAPAARKVLSIDEYSRWRTIDGAQISPDGKYVVYGLRYTNTLPADAKPVVTLRDLSTGTDLQIADA